MNFLPLYPQPTNQLPVPQASHDNIYFKTYLNRSRILSIDSDNDAFKPVHVRESTPPCHFEHKHKHGRSKWSKRNIEQELHKSEGEHTVNRCASLFGENKRDNITTA